MLTSVLSKLLLAVCVQGENQSLESQLVGGSRAELVRAVRELGDASRGAVVFHQPYLTCIKCHATGETTAKPLGPDLADPRLFPKLIDDTDQLTHHIIESIVAPSAVIRKGYEQILIALDDGRTLTGLFVKEDAKAVVIRTANEQGQEQEIPKGQIEDRSVSEQSIMPSGLINQLASRQQFLDLVAYLVSIARGGAARALELRPNPSLYAASIPEYESRIDHARFLRGWNVESLERGSAIYHRVCANCHGTHDQPGSLPTAPRFATAALKNGGDPYALYQTLTRGFGFMAPQSWMAPRQKYDVIHYIRESFLKEHNPSQYAEVTGEYLSGLPRGDTLGPEPSSVDAWAAMDYGPNLIHTYEIPTGQRRAEVPNLAYKGIAVRLDSGPGGVSRGEHWVIFDHDTMRVAGGWTRTGSERFIDWQGIQFNGKHGVHPKVAGEVAFSIPPGPGWADPSTGRFDDPRLIGRDDRRYGPLPRQWARYRGLYHHGREVVVAYTIGSAEILEQFGHESYEGSDASVFTRTIDVGRSPHDLMARVAGVAESVALVGGGGGIELVRAGEYQLLRVPASATPAVVKVLITAGPASVLSECRVRSAAPGSLKLLTQGSSPRWPETVLTDWVIGRDDGPLGVDELQPPNANPWLAQMRLTGFDFFPGGDRAAVCTWDGDVWQVSGLIGSAGLSALESGGDGGGRVGGAAGSATGRQLAWRRVASGLFQPLGLKIVRDRIYVTCRDQIAVLHDLNGDGETDFYENFNNDHQVTEHFHEFAMGLQTDAAGNFYYAKSARHALKAVVPHHGTLLRVSKDGSRTEIIARGFRAANGVCLNPDGTFIVTDQEGHWNPKNRINWVRPGGFYGNMFAYHDVTDSSDQAMEQPLCWITNKFDRSPAELVWVPNDAWGPLGGSLLNLSYGYGKVFVVPHETIAGQPQGGMCELPIEPLPTGIMRGRFNEADGQLYVCGMFAWAGNATQPGGFYRIRYTGKPIHVPLAIRARNGKIAIQFSGPLDPGSCKPDRFTIHTWSLRRTAGYGSDHYDEKPLQIENVSIADDGRTVTLDLPDLEPVWCMEIKYGLRSSSGGAVSGTIHNTVHRLGGD